MLLWIAGFKMIFAGNFHSRFGRLGTAGDKEDARQSGGRTGGNVVGQVNLRIGQKAAVGKSDLACLRMHRVGNLRDAVANADDMHAGASIDVAATIGIVQVNAFTVRNLLPVRFNHTMKNMVSGHIAFLTVVMGGDLLGSNDLSTL